MSLSKNHIYITVKSIKESLAILSYKFMNILLQIEKTTDLFNLPSCENLF